MVVMLRIAAGLRKVVWRLLGPRTIGVRALVVDGNGRILLVRHTYGPQAWHLPGGGVKRRESLEEAVRREVHEETGIVVRRSLRLLGTYSNLQNGKSDHISVFVVEHWDREESDAAEIAEDGWFDPDQLPDGTTPGTRRRVQEFLDGTVSDLSW